MSTATESKVLAEFRSRSAELRLVRVPGRRLRDGETGEWTTTPEVVIEFANNRYECRDPDELEWLRAHQLMDVEGIGFVEVRPETIVPDAGPVLKEVSVAAATGDVELLQSIRAQEDAEWRRPDVLESADAALAALAARESSQE